jgi:hypothetical protein
MPGLSIYEGAISAAPGCGKTRGLRPWLRSLVRRREAPRGGVSGRARGPTPAGVVTHGRRLRAMSTPLDIPAPPAAPDPRAGQRGQRHPGRHALLSARSLEDAASSGPAAAAAIHAVCFAVCATRRGQSRALPRAPAGSAVARAGGRHLLYNVHAVPGARPARVAQRAVRRLCGPCLGHHLPGNEPDVGGEGAFLRPRPCFDADRRRGRAGKAARR